MNEILIVAAIIAATVFFGWFVKFREKQTEWFREAVFCMVGIGMFKREWQFKYEYTTPGGARIKSIVPVPAEALAAVDRGLQRRIDRFSVLTNWINYRNISDHDIFLIPPRGINQVNVPGAPHIHVNGITAAGCVIGCSDHLDALTVRPIILVPHQAEQNWQYLDYLADSVHNESEHVSGWRNRQYEPTNVFWSFVGPNDVHPWPVEAQSITAESLRTSDNVVIHNCGV